MTSHKDHRLDQLGIVSQDEADELQRELDIRFDRFTYRDRKVWNRQNSYLDAYARSRTVSDSADVAGVTVSTAQAWKYLDTLGFTRRLEIADLRFSDNLQVLALERAREPDAPASLLIALLRAHIPEKFSANGHLCDTSKSDELLYYYRQDAQRELAAGHPTLRAIANGTYQPPHSSSSHPRPSPTREDTAHPNLSPHGEENTTNLDLSPHGGETQRGGSSPTTQYDVEETTPPDDYPPLDEEDFAHSNLSPSAPSAVNPHDDIPPVDPDEVAFSNLSPAGGETQRGGSPSTPNRHSHPIASLYQTPRPHPNNDHNTFKVKRF